MSQNFQEVINLAIRLTNILNLKEDEVDDALAEIRIEYPLSCIYDSLLYAFNTSVNATTELIELVDNSDDESSFDFILQM
jgi:hypothetical protein